MTDCKTIQLAHGSGGKMSHELIQEVVFPYFNNDILATMHDAAFLPASGACLAFTTDTYVVKPRFFPGGDIGKLAVCGTVNDLAVSGAQPLYLSVGFVLEEGLPVAELRQICHSMQQAAAAAAVQIVTGDTKVVEKGAVDGIYINTAGIGTVLPGERIAASRVQAGQAVLLSGSLGDHAVAVMAKRYGLTLPAEVFSDCAPLNKMLQEMLTAVPGVVWLRDPTRGGLATTLNELTEETGLGILLAEEQIPVRPEVGAVCNILGFDPLYLANEGKVIVVVEENQAEEALAVMRKYSYGSEACRIGQIVKRPAGKVGVRTAIGGIRLLDMLTGDQLPRIC